MPELDFMIVAEVEVCTTYDGTVVKTVIRLTRRGRR